MKQLICVTSVYAVGGTFLEWSINYLSGKTKYLHYREGWIDLSNNPLHQINAHGHTKNHPSGQQKTQKLVNNLQEKSDFVSLYPFPLHADESAKILNLNIRDLNEEQLKTINDYQDTDYNQMLSWLSENNAHIIFISLDNSLPVYANVEVRSLDRKWHSPSPMLSIDERRQDLDSIFFQRSCKQWDDLNLTNIWDTRERLALNTRPLKFRQPNVNLAIPHYWIDSQELWYNGINKINDIMAWLNLQIDQTRIEHWQQVYNQWKNIQIKNLEFQYQYKHIIEATVNGWSYPIDLTFDQEVVIQHCLIYQHNLNLKTWQLEKFPKNTLELHKLLEPNIHPLN